MRFGRVGGPGDEPEEQEGEDTGEECVPDRRREVADEEEAGEHFVRGGEQQAEHDEHRQGDNDTAHDGGTLGILGPGANPAAQHLDPVHPLDRLAGVVRHDRSDVQVAERAGAGQAGGHDKEGRHGGHRCQKQAVGTANHHPRCKEHRADDEPLRTSLFDATADQKGGRQHEHGRHSRHHADTDPDTDVEEEAGDDDPSELQPEQRRLLVPRQR